MSAVITFLITSPLIALTVVWIALDERHDLTGHLIARSAWLRNVIARVTEYLDGE